MISPRELLARTPFTGRRFRTPDGFTFYQKKDGSWVDSLDRDGVDVTLGGDAEALEMLLDAGYAQIEAEKIMLGTWEPGPEELEILGRWYQGESRARSIIEAETPKGILQDPDVRLAELIRQLEQEHEPWPDSFKEGQRVRRTRLNPFGARPHGGEPNDIGDTGTVVRFIARRTGPERALYLVKWDRRPMGVHYMYHNALEAV